MDFGGQFENLERGTRRLALVCSFSLLLIFVLLFATFGTLRQAALVFTGIPLAAVGGVLAMSPREPPLQHLRRRVHRAVLDRGAERCGVGELPE